MSNLIRNKKKLNSSTDSLYSLSFDSPPETNGIPYDDYYDTGKNGASHIIDCMELTDNNYCDDGPDEPMSFFTLYKL